MLTEALRHGRGSVDLKELRGTYELEVSRGKLLHVGGNVATEHSLERERSMVAAVDRGIGRYAALGGEEKLTLSGGLREEQRRAVEAILESRDLAINLRGAAGTGETATLREVHRGLNHAGHEVLAVAPTRSAVEELHKVGFRDAMTITRLIEDETAHQRLRGNVLVVDEAGMISGRQMQGILDLAERQNARIVFSGDTRQIQSVESSDALRILERESKMTSVSLTGIQRQSNPEYREAIQTFRQSPDQGFAKLQEIGAGREVPYLERASAVGDVYREMTANSGRSVLVVAATHEEVGRVTHAIREDQKQHGQLSGGAVLDRHVPLQWTEAQKKDIANYQPGQVLVFHRASRGIEKHETRRIRLTPGALRDGEVVLSRHLPPPAATLPEFLQRFEHVYSPQSLSKVRQVTAVAAAHHRFLWIHPFYDGNGRVARLMSHALLRRLGVGNSLWSVARGLARNVGDYKALLMAADDSRRGDLDGRGNLSQAALDNFCRFFLRVSDDQVRYMSSILQPSELLRRMEIYVEDETRAGRLPKGSFPLLREALLAGEFERGLAPSLTGYKERMARTVVSKLLDAGLLVSPSHRAKVRLGLPLAVVERCFPALYPATAYTHS